MGTKITIRFHDNDVEKIKKLAKLENRSVSEFIRAKLRDSIQSEMKGTKLVERLLRKIEELPNQSQAVTQYDDELLKEVYKTLKQVYKHLRFLEMNFLVYADLTMNDGKEKFFSRSKELAEKFKIER